MQRSASSPFCFMLDMLLKMVSLYTFRVHIQSIVYACMANLVSYLSCSFNIVKPQLHEVTIFGKCNCVFTS